LLLPNDRLKKERERGYCCHVTLKLHHPIM
jgi:hypothetical protein